MVYRENVIERDVQLTHDTQITYIKICGIEIVFSLNYMEDINNNKMTKQIGNRSCSSDDLDTFLEEIINWYWEIRQQQVYEYIKLQ